MGVVNKYKEIIFFLMEKQMQYKDDRRKIKFLLDSPYKWGEGWTHSMEVLEIFNLELRLILHRLGVVPEVSEYGVIISEGKLKAYMHPQELSFEFSIADYEIEQIQDAIESVNSRYGTITKVVEQDPY